MQKKLKDILSDPPHGMGTLVNILLLLSLAMLLSIFFINPKEKNDIMLNLKLDKPIVEFKESQNQLAEVNYKKLYAIATVGQTIEKGDTLFSTLQAADIATINTWRDLLEKGTLLPTAQMVEMAFVDAAVKKKMIDLAKVKTRPRKVDNERIQQLKSDESELNNSIESYKRAIVKFKRLDKQYKKEFSKAKEEYEAGSLSLAELTKAKRKVDENKSIIMQREREMESENLLLFNAKSELDFISKSKATTAKMNKGSDNFFHEADLAKALDSLQQSSVVLAGYDGELEEIGDLNNVSTGDVLVTFAGEEIQSHRSKRLVATAINPKDVSRVTSGRALWIYLENGYKIEGKVIGSNEGGEGQFDIESNEELSDVEVDQIILPAKNENFIEKVLENF